MKIRANLSRLKGVDWTLKNTVFWILKYFALIIRGALAIILGVIGGIIGFFAFGLSASFRELSSEASAIWVQAALSLAAVLVAIWIPWAIHRNERKRVKSEQDTERRVNAAFLFSGLGEIESDLEVTIKNLEVISQAASVEFTLKAQPMLMVNIPNEISSSLSKLVLFDSQTARDIAISLSWIHSYNRRIENVFLSIKFHDSIDDISVQLMGLRTSVVATKGLMEQILPTLENIAGLSEPLPEEVLRKMDQAGAVLSSKP